MQGGVRYAMHISGCLLLGVVMLLQHAAGGDSVVGPAEEAATATKQGGGIDGAAGSGDAPAFLFGSRLP